MYAPWFRRLTGGWQYETDAIDVPNVCFREETAKIGRNSRFSARQLPCNIFRRRSRIVQKSGRCSKMLQSPRRMSHQKEARCTEQLVQSKSKPAVGKRLNPPERRLGRKELQN
jgi:hypothetical protein